jgi:hypothetical protein
VCDGADERVQEGGHGSIPSERIRFRQAAQARSASGVAWWQANVSL